MTCPSCGAPNHADFSFCLQCGHPLTPTGQESEQVGATRADMMPIEAGTMAMEPLPSTAVPRDTSPGAGPGTGSGSAPRVRLRVDSGSVDDEVIDLDRPLTVIGRRQGSDIVIHDTNVSRMHAQIKRDGARLIIEDTNSSNGTTVNDERIERPRELRAGDVIKIGDAVFVFEQDLAEPAAPDLGSVEGSTMAIDLDSPMTSLGGAPELLLPPLGRTSQAAAPVAAGGGQPLAGAAPGSGVIDGGHTSFAEGALFEDDEVSPAPRPAAEREPVAPVSPARAFAPAAAPDVSAAQQGTGSAPGGSTSAALESLRRELTEVGQELGAFSGTLSGLADRVERLERALDAATGDLASVADAIRGPDAAVLKELQGIVGEIERTSEGAQLDEAAKVLEQLAAQPRDIELLLKLSQQAGAIEGALRVHGRLVAAAPRLRSTLARLTG